MTKTLYEKIGGRPRIESLVTAFYQRVLSDSMLKPFFEDADIEKLHRMQVAFFTIATGGPEPDSEISLFEAHQGRGIEVKHLTQFTELLLETLKSIGIEENDAADVYARISSYSNDILGETSIDG